jgi:hypothetical protein
MQTNPSISTYPRHPFTTAGTGLASAPGSYLTSFLKNIEPFFGFKPYIGLFCITIC